MKLSVIVPDNKIVIDGEARTVDLSAPAALGIHAVQWDGSRGHLEAADPGTENTPLNKLDAVQEYIDLWETNRPAAPDLPAEDPQRLRYFELREKLVDQLISGETLMQAEKAEFAALARTYGRLTDV